MINLCTSGDLVGVYNAGIPPTDLHTFTLTLVPITVNKNRNQSIMDHLKAPGSLYSCVWKDEEKSTRSMTLTTGCQCSPSLPTSERDWVASLETGRSGDAKPVFCEFSNYSFEIPEMRKQFSFPPRTTHRCLRKFYNPPVSNMLLSSGLNQPSPHVQSRRAYA
ncbi:uncharacterized protein BDR25DRAFT_354174 [Lindgomyces ingoldianus]|uniref:Uncharacterized protein n=1 Tax=Lindgomyces ingoldianus TaxID=673940 RepID=A0ACB6QXQ9_9PLEO|nr:uncharacterized protein BDR25DRAFT_354174 [Lindgomyces ingoldianus]KAF2471671.1 hypothetical protein BDR25DRAFT_354174 [Lindgomyces ingoldianus]